jgi:hypothetical protein
MAFWLDDSQIFRTRKGETLVLLGDDVIDLVDWQGRLRELAVFAPVPGPPPDSPPEIVGHGDGFARLSDSRALDWRTASS